MVAELLNCFTLTKKYCNVNLITYQPKSYIKIN